MRRFFFFLFLCWNFLGTSCIDAQIALMPCGEIDDAFQKFVENHPNDCEQNDDCELLAVKGMLRTCERREFIRFMNGFAASKKYREFRVFHDRYFSKDCDGKRSFVFDLPFTSKAICEKKRCKVWTDREFVCPNYPSP